MSETEQQTKPTVSSEQEITIGSLVKTALKTLYLCVAIFALLATLFTLLFPLQSMRFYDDIGLNGRAYACASRAVRTERGEDKVTAKLYSVNLLSELFESEPKAYADELYKVSKDFLLDEACLSRAVKVDIYNLSSCSKALQPNLYSYATFVRELNARSAFRLEKIEEMKTYFTSSATSITARAETLYALASVYYEVHLSGKKVDFYDDANLISFAKAYIAEVLSAVGEKPTLEQMYLIKAYEKFVARYLLTENADELKTVSYGGEQVNIGTLYTALLNKYSN